MGYSSEAVCTQHAQGPGFDTQHRNVSEDNQDKTSGKQRRGAANPDSTDGTHCIPWGVSLSCAVCVKIPPLPTLPSLMLKIHKLFSGHTAVYRSQQTWSLDPLTMSQWAQGPRLIQSCGYFSSFRIDSLNRHIWHGQKAHISSLNYGVWATILGNSKLLPTINTRTARPQSTPFQSSVLPWPIKKLEWFRRIISEYCQQLSDKPNCGCSRWAFY